MYETSETHSFLLVSSQISLNEFHQEIKNKPFNLLIYFYFIKNWKGSAYSLCTFHQVFPNDKILKSYSILSKAGIWKWYNTMNYTAELNYISLGKYSCVWTLSHTVICSNNITIHLKILHHTKVLLTSEPTLVYTTLITFHMVSTSSFYFCVEYTIQIEWGNI